MSFSSGYQQVKLHEGTAQIWIETRYIDDVFYTMIAWYWAAQIWGSLGLGDINVTQTNDLIFTLVCLYIAVLSRCAVMCRSVKHVKARQINNFTGVSWESFTISRQQYSRIKHSTL